jgi:hypothetical protein
MARKSNIRIFRAEESKKTEPKERKVEDIAIVNELCKITGTNKQTAISVASSITLCNHSLANALTGLCHHNIHSSSFYSLCVPL